MSKDQTKEQFRKNMDRFAEVSNGCIKVMVILPADILELIAAEHGGNEDAYAMICAMAQYLARIEDRKQPSMLCLHCDTEFNASVSPTSFSIAMPYANPVGAVINGICRDCVLKFGIDRDRLLAKSSEAYQRLWDLTPLQEGNA